MLTSKCAFLFLLPFIYPSTILDQVNVLVDRAYATHHIYTQEDLDIAMAMENLAWIPYSMNASK